MLGYLALEELHAAGQLLHAVHAVFDADPAIEAFALQFAENGVVVVEPLANLAVAQTLRIALSAAFFTA